jgi:hypothetical protein
MSTDPDIIAQARALCQAATPGPWNYDDSSIQSLKLPEKDRVHGYGYGTQGFICDLNDGEYHEYINKKEQDANGLFIARSRELVPKLADVAEKRGAMLVNELTAMLYKNKIGSYEHCEQIAKDKLGIEDTSWRKIGPEEEAAIKAAIDALRTVMPPDIYSPHIKVLRRLLPEDAA